MLNRGHLVIADYIKVRSFLLSAKVNYMYSPYGDTPKMIRFNIMNVLCSQVSLYMGE